MGSAALVVGAAMPLTTLVFCGAPAQPPVHAPGPPVAEPAPSGTAPITSGSDGATEKGHTAGEPSASPPADDSGVGEGDASMRSPDSGLSADQVRQVVVTHHGALHACYESEAQKNPTFRGSVILGLDDRRERRGHQRQHHDFNASQPACRGLHSPPGTHVAVSFERSTIAGPGVPALVGRRAVRVRLHSRVAAKLVRWREPRTFNARA